MFLKKSCRNFTKEHLNLTNNESKSFQLSYAKTKDCADCENSLLIQLNGIQGY